MRRLFWMAAGATAAYLVVRQARKAAQSLTPPALAQSLGSSIGDLADAIRDFGAEVRAGMAERESELRDALGLDGRHDVVDASTMETYPTGGPEERW